MNDVLTNFVPSLFNPAAAPAWSAPPPPPSWSAPATSRTGSSSPARPRPTGGGSTPTEWNKIQPRVGFSWDPKDDGTDLVRGGYGVYYDQPLVGIFLQNAFINPPFVTNPVVLNPLALEPRRRHRAAPRCRRWPSSRAATTSPCPGPSSGTWACSGSSSAGPSSTSATSGSRGDDLIQPVDINDALPADVVATNGVLNLARPYQGYAGINMRQTTATRTTTRLTVGFRYDAGRSGTLSIAYTLSQAKTNATNDRDAVDLPQDRTDLDAEYALARTDRTHIFTANWVYELPFFKDSTSRLVKATVRGWQISGIATFWTGVRHPADRRTATRTAAAGAPG